MRIIAVIPAYNEAEAITDVVTEARKHCADVVVVDDASTDKTAEVLAELSKSIGIKYVVHRRNQGQGGATRTGILIARSLGADFIMTLDGDGQHDATQIPDLLAPLLAGSADIVIGSRFISSAQIPRYRSFGIRVITWAFNIGARPKLSDALLCFRAFRSTVFDVVHIEDEGFGFCPEVLIKARHEKIRIAEIPANCTYFREYQRNSTFGPVKLAAILSWKILLWRARVEYGINLSRDWRFWVPRQTTGKNAAREVRGH